MDWHGQGTSRWLDSRSLIPRGSCCRKKTGTSSFPASKVFIGFNFLLDSWACLISSVWLFIFAAWRTSWNNPSRPSPLTWVTRFIILLSFCIKCSITSPEVEQASCHRLSIFQIQLYQISHLILYLRLFTWFSSRNLAGHDILQALRIFLNELGHLSQKV